MIWFTADTHFGHANIIKYTNRPFGSVGEMNEEIIHRWNEVVGDDDVVYHLGDFTLSDLEDAKIYFPRLNGRISVLGTWWHHDRRWMAGLQYQGGLSFVALDSPRSASNHQVRIIPPLFILTPRQSVAPPVVLCHYPLAIWDRKHYGAWHLHGHSHGRYQGEGFIYDVGVDNNGFYPVSLERVAEIMESKGWHEGWRQYA